MLMLLDDNRIFRRAFDSDAWFDRHVVDGFMNLLARTTQSAALGIRFMQSGSIQRYCIWFFAGTLGLTLLLLILR